MLPKSDKQRGILAVIGIAFMLALTGMFARMLGTVFTPLQQVYIRVGAALILSFPLFYRNLDFSKIKNIPGSEWSLLTIRSVSTYILGVVPFSIAVGLAKLSTVAFISALPIVAILGIIVLKEKLTAQKILYLGLGLIGVLMFTIQDYSNILSWGKGEMLTLMSVIFISLGMVLRRKHSNFLNNYEISILSLFIGTALLVVISLIMSESLLALSSWSPFIIFAILGAGVVNVAYQIFSNYGFQKIDAVLANNLLILSPLFATLLGFLLYQETPNAKELLAGGIIIISAYKMNKVTG